MPEHSKRVIVAVAENEYQLAIVEQLFQHEKPHQRNSSERTMRQINRAIARIRVHSSDAFRLPLEVFVSLQDAGLPILGVLDIIDTSWRELQAQRHRFTPALSDCDVREVHEKAVWEISAALLSSPRTVFVRQPSNLIAAIRCAWRQHPTSFDAFIHEFTIAMALCEFGFAESEISLIVNALDAAAVAGIGIGLTTGELLRDEVLAIARHADRCRTLAVADQYRIITAFATLRGRVRPDRFLRTVESIGVDSAIAFHARTENSGAVRLRG